MCSEGEYTVFANGLDMECKRKKEVKKNYPAKMEE